MISISHLHPMLVHFPIALIVFGFIAQISSLIFIKEVCLSKTTFYLLIAGTLTAVVSWLSGALFTAEMSGMAGEIKETHEHAALVTLVLLIVTSALSISIKIKGNESRNLNRAILVLYGMATIAVSITGYYGGTLVYNYMMPL